MSRARILVDQKGATAYRVPPFAFKVAFLYPSCGSKCIPNFSTVADEFMFNRGKDDYSKSSQSLLQTIHLSYHQLRQEASDFDITSS